MNKFINFGKRLGKDEAGATAIEYALLAALIAVVLIGAVGALGTTVKGEFNSITTALGGKPAP